jgi:hypothetical protein
MLGKRSHASMSIASSVKYFSTSSTSVDARRFNPSRKRFFFGSYNGKRQPFNVFIDLLIATARWRWSHDRYRSTPFALDLALDKLVRSIARSRSQKNERSLNRSRSINRSRQLCFTVYTKGVQKVYKDEFVHQLQICSPKKDESAVSQVRDHFQSLTPSPMRFNFFMTTVLMSTDMSKAISKEVSFDYVTLTLL